MFPSCDYKYCASFQQVQDTQPTLEIESNSNDTREHTRESHIESRKKTSRCVDQANQRSESSRKLDDPVMTSLIRGVNLPEYQSRCLKLLAKCTEQTRNRTRFQQSIGSETSTTTRSYHNDAIGLMRNLMRNLITNSENWNPNLWCNPPRHHTLLLNSKTTQQSTRPC